MSLFHAEGANESERERNRGARLILKAIADDLNDKSIGMQLATQVVAIETEKSLTGCAVLLHVTNPLAATSLLRWRLPILASVTRILAAVSLPVEGLEIMPADEALIARIKHNEASRAALLGSEQPGYKPKTLTEMVTAAL